MQILVFSESQPADPCHGKAGLHPCHFLFLLWLLWLEGEKQNMHRQTSAEATVISSVTSWSSSEATVRARRRGAPSANYRASVISRLVVSYICVGYFSAGQGSIHAISFFVPLSLSQLSLRLDFNSVVRHPHTR